MSRAWIAFGGNLGDREASFAAALHAFEADPQVDPVRGSAVYETEPVGPGDQERYWNAVLEAETTLPPRRLLERCLAIETALGRVRRERWGARPIDLDILLYGDLRIREEGLEIPHPLLHQRSFVLLPLADLAPARRVKGRTVFEWLECCGPVDAVRVRESLWPWR